MRRFGRRAQALSLRVSAEAEASALRQRECYELARILPPRNGDHDVLLAADHVGHRRVADAGGQFHLPRDRAGLLVERAELLAAPGTTRRQTHAGVAAFTHEDERLGDERRVAPRRADGWKVEALERWMIADAVAVGDRPQDVALVQIDRDEA